MICPHCGKETARDSAFCAVCGAKIASDVPKLYTRPTDKPNANDSAGSATSVSTVTVVVEAPKKEKKKKKLGCFTIFLIVLAVIIGLWIIGSEPQKEDVEAAIVPFQNSEFLNGLLRAELVAHKLSNMEDVEAIQIEKAESYSVTQVERAVNNGSLYYVQGDIECFDKANKPVHFSFSFSILFTSEHVPTPEQIQTLLDNGQYEMQDDFYLSSGTHT